MELVHTRWKDGIIFTYCKLDSHANIAADSIFQRYKRTEEYFKLLARYDCVANYALMV